jgi:hypothetical protein
MSEYGGILVEKCLQKHEIPSITDELMPPSGHTYFFTDFTDFLARKPVLEP